MVRGVNAARDAGLDTDASDITYADTQYSSEHVDGGWTTGTGSGGASTDADRSDIPTGSSFWSHRHRRPANGNSKTSTERTVTSPPPVARSDVGAGGLRSQEAPTSDDTETTWSYTSPPTTPTFSQSTPPQIGTHGGPPPPAQSFGCQNAVDFTLPSDGTMHTATVPPTESNYVISPPPSVYCPSPSPVGMHILRPNGLFHIPEYEDASGGALFCYFIGGLFVGIVGNILACLLIIVLSQFMRDRRAKAALTSGIIVGAIVNTIIGIVLFIVFFAMFNSKRQDL